MIYDSYIEQIRRDFPVLQTKVNNYPLAYLDNAATTQKPQIVIDAFADYYQNMNANVHRAVHHLSELATVEFENARRKVQKFINAKQSTECVFVRGTTEAVNLVASSFGSKFVTNGDEVLITMMEHHSNLVPWKMLCERTGAKLVAIPVTENGELDLDKVHNLLNSKTKILALTHVSNSLGTINPVKKIIQLAHAKNIPVLLDGAQALAHLKVDVQDLDCDFYTASAHKCYGPLGIGVLYAKHKWLEQLPPYQGGGEMILKVSLDHITYNEPPFKFEAGTPSIADAIAWGRGIDYLNSLDRDKIHQYEQDLLAYATEKLLTIPGLKIYGTAAQKVSIISFVLDGIHPHDIGTISDKYGVAIRTGHHCNMPLMDFYNITGTARASFGMYNTIQEVDQLCAALLQVQAMFNRHK